MVLYKNLGQYYGKSFNSFNIAAVEAEGKKIIAWYIGYYDKKTDSYKLYPEELTKNGKELKYKMEKQIIKSSEIMKEEKC